MRPFLLVRQVRADSMSHHYDESTIIHVEPVRATNKFIVTISYEWTVDILAYVWLVKSCHWLLRHVATIQFVRSRASSAQTSKKSTHASFTER
jgi:hypothetical protein